MERLSFELECRAAGPAPAPGGRAPAAPVLVGVVGSGNLEVLVEGGAPAGRCRVEVATSVRGFGEIWRAVVEDFVARQQPGGLRVSVNDAGATPAVVSLRLDQAVEEFRGGRP
jgi:malonate decarboxylase delta subunit